MVQEHVGFVRELVPLLFVDDIERSVAFYRDRLGFDVAATWEPDGRLSWCRVQRDGAALMLQQATEEDSVAEQRGLGVGFFFVCNDARAVHAELVSRGLSPAVPAETFYGMSQVFVQDPDGYELCFESPVAASVTQE